MLINFVVLIRCMAVVERAVIEGGKETLGTDISLPLFEIWSV